MLFQSQKQPTELKITHLNKVKQQREQQLTDELNAKHRLKPKKKPASRSSLITNLKQAILQKTKKTDSNAGGTVFVLDFVGDIKASQVQQLREEISTLLTCAKAGDEVVVRLESSGGLVHAYGLAAAQLARIKEAGIRLTVCVDKIAASGGYMMACVADCIIAAPFAVIGSIGVVAQVPNFHDLLQKHDVDVEVFTAGKYKRTVTVFGKNDAEDKQKFQQELEQTHQLFKDFVNHYRPSLNVEQVATGEHWYGEDAIYLKLVDKLATSDSYLLDLMKDKQVYAISTRRKPTVAEKLGLSQAAEAGLQAMVTSLAEQLPAVAQPIKLLKKID